MKKVGLITYYGDNYGGVLQAYALQRRVKTYGYDCELISNAFMSRRRGRRRVKRLLENLGSAIKAPADYWNKRNTYRRYAAQNAKKAERFKAFREDNLTICDVGYGSYGEYLERPPQYDVYLCGSDQIWNPNLHSETGFYFAGFAPDHAVKVSYASSVGVSSVTRKQADFMAPLLNRLDVISTREQKGADIINAISEKTAAVVLDPTLLLNAEEWSEVAAPRLIDEPYIFCYLFGERDYIAKVKRTVQAMTGLRLVCIPYVSRELEAEDRKVFDAGPAEFVSLIKNAELVLTDSFHATAFSINLMTPFVSLCRFAKDDKKSMNDRLVTILSLTGLQDRLVDAGDPLDKDFLFNVDFERAHRLLQEKRREDSEFLRNALGFDKTGESHGDL